MQRRIKVLDEPPLGQSLHLYPPEIWEDACRWVDKTYTREYIHEGWPLVNYDNGYPIMLYNEICYIPLKKCKENKDG
jgi:hypothetical protein